MERRSYDSTRRNQQMGADVGLYFCKIVVNEMSDSVVRDSTQPCPCPQGSDRRFATNRKDTAIPETNNVSEGAF